MGDYMYRGNIGLAEVHFERENYGPARCEFEACLERERKKRGKNRNRQMIEYLERMISECTEMIRRQHE